MFRNYIKITLRNLRKYKGYSFINIAGLAIGLACCVMILFFVQHELSYDNFHENADDIYRVSREWKNADGETSLHLGHVAPPIGPLLESDFSDIQEMTRMLGFSALVSHNDNFFQEDNIFFAEENFFKVFTFPLVKGNPETALSEPGTVVITESIAEKFFPNGDAYNQTLRFFVRGIQADFKITGITADVPVNAHFHYELIASFKTYETFATDLESWGSNNYSTFLLMPENYNIENLASQVDGFIGRHHPNGEQAIGRTTLHFMPLKDIHLHSNLDSEIEANGDINNVYIFSAIAVLILLIACINFMNLATARSARRAKEVGMRKVVGAKRSQLIFQFLGESILLALLSLGLALILVVFFLPTYEEFLGYSLAMSFQNNLLLAASMLGIALFVGLLSGSYPAFFLSSFKPVSVLKKSGKVSGGAAATLRKTLVVLQFSISLVLMIAVGMVYKQLNYVHNKDLGFSKDQVVVLPSSQEIINRFESVQSRLLQHPNIEEVSIAKRVPTGRLLDSWGTNINYAGTDDPINFRIAALVVDHDYLETYGIDLAAGRNFDRALASDSTEAFILNEAAIKRIGWESADEAIGQPMGYGSRNGFIIGVVKDFHFESLRNKISPICMVISNRSLNQVSIKIKENDTAASLAFLEKQWAELRPNFPFEYEFIDERFSQLYASEKRLMEIFGFFSVLAILIACLGLFGLASFSAEQRTKEIGIRKVLGASVGKLILMLSQEFTKFVLIANLIAWPIAYYAMNSWLQEFAYHTEIAFSIFIFATIAAFLIAVLTVGYQAIKASLANPVRALRYE